MTWQTRDPSDVGLDPSVYTTGQIPAKDADGGFSPGATPVSYQDTPTVDTLRDALVSLGLMLPAPPP